MTQCKTAVTPVLRHWSYCSPSLSHRFNDSHRCTQSLKWTLFSCNLGPQFNIKMSSYQYSKSHCGDETILRPSYLHSGISYTGKMTSLYWIRAQIANLALAGIPLTSTFFISEACWQLVQIKYGICDVTLAQYWELIIGVLCAHAFNSLRASDIIWCLIL